MEPGKFWKNMFLSILMHNSVTESVLIAPKSTFPISIFPKAKNDYCGLDKYKDIV